MSHCFPCSGSGWYMTGSFTSGSCCIPFLSGPFAEQSDALSVAQNIILTSTSSCEQIETIDIFLHETSREEDAWRFFDLMERDAWDDEFVEIFTGLTHNHPSASNIISCLSSAYGLRMQIADLDAAGDIPGALTLRQQRSWLIADALDMTYLIFGERP